MEAQSSVLSTHSKPSKKLKRRKSHFFHDHASIRSQVRWPALTLGLAFVLILLFIGELFSTGSIIEPGLPTLVSFGGLVQGLILNHQETYRLLTAAFLHASYIHLVLNLAVLVVVGSTLERFIGRSWFFTIFILSSIIGGIFSLYLNNPSLFTVGVGASGGISGLVAALMAVSFHLPKGPKRVQLQARAIYILVPAILPIFIRNEADNVDYAAHLGGMITGLLIGVFIYWTWSKDSKQPRFLKVATVLSFFCGAITLLTGYQAWERQPSYQAQLEGFQLAPTEELNRLFDKVESPSENVERVNRLLRKYPNDPALYYIRAYTQVEEKNYEQAGEILKVGLKKTEVLERVFSDRKWEKLIRILLAHVQLKLGEGSSFIVLKVRETLSPICEEILPRDGHPWFSDSDLKLNCQRVQTLGK